MLSSSYSSPSSVPPQTRPVATAGVATMCFSLQADIDPGTLPRVLELFAKRGLVPNSWISRTEGTADLSIDVQIDAMEWQQAELLAASMRQIPMVRTVLTSQRHAAG